MGNTCFPPSLNNYLTPLFFILFFQSDAFDFQFQTDFSHCFNHSHDLVFTKYCSLYYLSFLNSLSLITTCSLSAYLSFSLLYPVTHSFWDLPSINLSDSFTLLSCLLPSLGSLPLTHWSLFSSLSASLYMVSLVMSHIALSPCVSPDIFSCYFLISIPAFPNISEGYVSRTQLWTKLCLTCSNSLSKWTF